MIVEHEEHPDELALAEGYVLEISNYASMNCGDRYILDEDTSIWDPGSVDTSGVHTRSLGWHWDLSGVFHHIPKVQDDYNVGGMVYLVTKCTHSLREFQSTLVGSQFIRRLWETSWHIICV